jgi:predicted nucleic acid-binding protein
MSRVFWDTNLFIYLIDRNDHLYTSTLTLGEVLVKPVEARNEPLREKYQSAISAGAILIPFDSGAAVRYAQIRRDRTIRAPDAIQLACAAAAGIDLFITNDERLSQKSVTGIQFISSLERAFL